MSQNTYESWEKYLAQYKKVLDKELKEIRKEKSEIQKLKEELYENMNKGMFIHDKNRIILSAPEIIIGDLNQAGELNPQHHSKVIIRSNDISLQGVGDQGSINNQATIINNSCVDTGIDGNEAVINNGSAFLTQAKNITLQSNNDVDFFYTPCAPGEGININSDSKINLKAAKPCKVRKEILTKKKNEITNQKAELDRATNAMENIVKKYIQQIKTLTAEKDKMSIKDDEIETNYQDFYQLNENIRLLMQALSCAVDDYTNTMSCIAEKNRQLKALNESKKIIDGYEANYKQESTNASINIFAETTSINSIDADGNRRINEGAGVNIRAKEVNVDARNYNGSLIEKSQLNIQTHDVNVNTVNSKMNEDGTIDNTAEGDVHIISKNIIMESVDIKKEKEKFTESALTKEGCIKLRAENLDLTTHDTEGNAGGKFSLNSKDITLKSMNVDTKNNEDKDIAEKSNINLIADSITAGIAFFNNGSERCNNVQIEGNSLNITGKNSVAIQQVGDQSCHINMQNGSIALAGEKAHISGNLTVHDKTTFEKETTQSDATIKSLTVQKSLHSPSTTEGTK